MTSKANTARLRLIQDAAMRLLAEVDNHELQSAWGRVEIELRGKRVILHMPGGSLFDDLYRVVTPALNKLRLDHSKADRWYNAADLDDVLGDVTWLWPSWIPNGFLTLIVGEPGSGKSLLALDWIRIVTTGGSWPLGVEQGKATNPVACWIETESSQQLLNIRSKSMGVPRKHILLPGFNSDLLGQPDMMDPDDQMRVTNLVKHNKPGIVVLDSLGGAHTRGENKIEEVRPMLSYLANLARDEGVAVLAVHHLRKRGNGEDFNITLDRVRGSSAYSAYARSIVALDRNANGDLSLQAIKANLCAPPAPIGVRVVSNKHGQPESIEYSEWEAPQPKQNKRAKCAQWVIDTLRASAEPIRFADLVTAGSALGYSRSLLYAARDNDLDGAIEITGDGRSAYWALVQNPFSSKGKQ